MQQEMEQEAFEMLSIDEGLRLTVYLDTRGVPTIGYGRNLRSKGVRKSEAVLLLKNDIEDAVNDLTKNFPWFISLSVNRRVVLIDMHINLGMEGLAKFKKFLSDLAKQDYQAAAQELRSAEVYKTLTTRYERLARITESDIYEHG